MADFCQQCSLAMFGKDFEDMANLGDHRDLKPGWGYQVLCEGCGPTLVDDEGKCISDCDLHHESAA